MIINIFEAKTNLSKLIQQCLEGEEIIIANRGKAMVRLVPIEAKGINGFGKHKDWGNYDEAFSAETDDALANLFGLDSSVDILHKMPKHSSERGIVAHEVSDKYSVNQKKKP